MKIDIDERCCKCCGRQQSQLKEVDGQSLFLVHRRLAPYGDGVEIYEKYLDICKGNQSLTGQLLYNTYSERTVDRIMILAQAYDTIEPFWECYDCASLDGEDYDNKFSEEMRIKTIIPLKEPNWSNLPKVITETIKERKSWEKTDVELSEKDVREVLDTVRSLREAKELYRQKYATNNHRCNEKPL